ncbi:DUF397 domain-containing protein [Kitasatospora sp. NPDC092948]|uniref:DUF397 domain-containing protein n=1 Tax=Kitasatospora sp. NPDC092948 TaxID=3364088 RepID=UPI00382F1FDD
MPSRTRSLTVAVRTNCGSAHHGSPPYSIEMAAGVPGATPVRDSKDPGGPALIFPTNAWSSFIDAVKTGHFGAV